MRLRLEDLTHDEQQELPRADLLRLRAQAYTRRVAAMTVPDDLSTWAGKMAKRYGPTVRVWEQELPWIEALLVVRYGEEPAHWPEAFTADDLNRATAWMKGRVHGGMKGTTPKGVTYLDLEDSGFVALVSGAHLLSSLTGLLVSLLTWFGLGSVAGAFTNYSENKIIDWFWRGIAFTPPTTFYFALYTAAPGETGGGTEVSGGSYARVSVSQAYNQFQGTGGETTNTGSTGTGGATQNVNTITFPAPSADWGVASHMAVLDAATSGNMLTYGALTNAKTINNGDPAPYFGAGDFVFTID